MRRWIPVVVVAAAVAVGILGWPAGPAYQVSDAAPDFLYVNGAWHGLNPHDTSWELLAERFGGPKLDYGAASKTPAVAVVLAGWLVVPFDWVQPLALVANTLALAGICYLSAAIAGRRFVWWMAVPVFALYPVQVSWWIGNPIFVWVFLVLLTWRWTQKGDVWWAGVPLGVAAAVRLWPGLLAVALWVQGKRRAAVGAAGVAVVLNLAGLAAPGLDASSSLSGLAVAGASWVDFGTNSSLVRLFGGSSVVFVVLVVAAILLVWRTRSVEAAAITGVLVTPLSWMSYWMVAGPVFVRLWPWSALPLILIGFSRSWQAVAVAGVGLFVLWWLSRRQLNCQSSTSEMNVHDENPVVVTRQ